VTTPPDAELVLVEPRRRQYALVAIDGVFVVIGVALAVTGDTAWGLAGATFFGVALVFAGTAIARPARLVLRTDGFQFVNLGRRSQLFEWSKSSNFHPWSPAAGATFIAFDYDGPRPVYRGRLARLNRSLTGSNSCLPSTYGMQAAQLCRLLEQHRRPQVSHPNRNDPRTLGS